LSSSGPILVTGATGFAGSHLIELLWGSDAPLGGWHRPGSAVRSDEGRMRWWAVDLLDSDGVARAVAEFRPRIIFHCAGAAHVAQSWGEARETLETNVLGTHHLIKALRRAGLEAQVLIPGSALVYRQSARAISEDDPLGPSSPYALSKLAQEMLGVRAIAEDGQHVFLTRSFTHMGPRQEPSYAASGFARQIALVEAGRMPPVIEVGNLDASRDLTDVRDTVRAYAAIIERGRPGVIYNVCSGRAYRIGDVLERLLGMSHVPIELHVDASRLRPNDMPLSLGNPARVEREVGWRPEIDLDRSLTDLMEYWRTSVGIA
jgi:GDP-4-dehydro-6-deoxy-D-mannose reductase